MADSRIPDYILWQLWTHPTRKWRLESCLTGAASSAPPTVSCRASHADGGFNIYVKGPSEISASVKAYFALKMREGLLVGDPRMARSCA